MLLDKSSRDILRTITSSYVSEAAASLLDERLNLHIVPKTQLVSFASPVCIVYGARRRPLITSLIIGFFL